MKRFLLFLATAALVHGQTYDVKVDANGNVLHSKLQNAATNPNGNVNFATGKLLVNGVSVTTGGGGGGAPVDATYITETSNGTLTNEFALGSLVTGILKNTTTTGIPTIAVAGTDYVSPNISITGATKTKITYDAKGLVISGADATTADINDSTDRRYVTDAQRTVIQNTSGTNTGDQNLSGFVQNTRTISTTVPLTGGGDLSANRTLAINNAAADGTTKGAASFTTNDFDATSGNVSLDYVNGQKATTVLPGFLSAADWTTFNAKGNGTVTSFSAGDLSPLFTTTEATITTTPALSFTLSTAGANTFFGNGTGSTAVPNFMSASTARTALGLVIGTNVEAWDADLDALAAASRVGAIYYRSSSTPTWDAVKYGAGIQFVNGVLNTVNTNAQIVSEATKSSSSTLNLSGETETNYDITGTTNISAITLEEGRTVLLRFTGAGLTLTPGASLLLPGGAPIITSANGWGLFLGGAAGIVTCTDYQDAAGYSKQTFDNIFMNQDANIRVASEFFGGSFNINRDDSGSFASAGKAFFRFAPAALQSVQLLRNDLTGGALFRVDGLTDFRRFTFPDFEGTFSLVNGAETLTNKTIDASQLVDGTVTLAKQANMATASVVYRKTAGSGIPEVNTLATLKTDLGLTGTNSGDQTITLTGDVTGSGTGSFAATIANGAVTFAKLNSAAWDDDTTLAVPSSTRVPTTNATANYVADYVAASLGDYLPFTGGTMIGQIVTVAGTASSNTAGIKLTSGALQTTPQAGAVEFVTDVFYLTQTTSATRKSIVLAPSTGPVTISGPTAARTMTVPNANFTAARTDAANTFTGVQTMTSPAITTPAITGLATGSGVASAATASTLAARDSNGDLTANNLISSTAGKGLQLQSGTGARAGNATLVGGTVTVTNSTVDSTKDILMITRKTSGGTIGTAITYTLSNATSFTINSDNILDTSTFSYMLVKVN